MKKILSLGLLLSSALFASHEEGVRFGFGGRAGIAAFTGKIKSNVNVYRDANNTPTTLLYNSLRTIKADSVSFQGGVFAEVGYRSCDWSFGALIDVNGDTLKSRSLDFVTTYGAALTAVPLNSQDLLQYCVKAPAHIGGDIRAGRYVGDALWYGLIGAEAIRVQLGTYVSFVSVNPIITPAVVANPLVLGAQCWGGSSSCTTTSNNCCNNSCDASWKGALRVGTGIEYNWSDCLNMKLEYRFLWAGKKTILLNSPIVSNNNGTNARSTHCNTLYFRQSVTALMLSYQF